MIKKTLWLLFTLVASGAANQTAPPSGPTLSSKGIIPPAAANAPRNVVPPEKKQAKTSKGEKAQKVSSTKPTWHHNLPLHIVTSTALLFLTAYGTLVHNSKEEKNPNNIEHINKVGANGHFPDIDNMDNIYEEMDCKDYNQNDFDNEFENNNNQNGQKNDFIAKPADEYDIINPEYGEDDEQMKKMNKEVAVHRYTSLQKKMRYIITVAAMYAVILVDNFLSRKRTPAEATPRRSARKTAGKAHSIITRPIITALFAGVAFLIFFLPDRFSKEIGGAWEKMVGNDSVKTGAPAAGKENAGILFCKALATLLVFGLSCGVLMLDQWLCGTPHSKEKTSQLPKAAAKSKGTYAL